MIFKQASSKSIRLIGYALLLSSSVAHLSAQVQQDPELEPEYNVSRSSWGSGLLYINDVVLESESPDPLLNDKVDLIHDDETLSSDIPEGRSVFLVSLKDSSIVNSFRFYNFDAEGAVMAYVRADNTENEETPWIPVSDTVTYSEVGPVVVWFNQEIEAQLVRIVFDTSKTGHISGFGVAGSFFRGVSPKQTQLVRQTQATDNQAMTNVLSPSSGAQVIATSDGLAPSSKAMIDDLVETTHVFSETDPEPIAIFDLGEPREIERVSVLIDSPHPTTMEVYFLEDLDDIEGLNEPQPVALIDQLKHSPLIASRSISNWIMLAAQSGPPAFINGITVPDGFFDDITPNVICEFDAGSRRSRSNVGGSSFAQFVLVRWVYGNGLPSEFGGLTICELNFLGRYVWYYEGEDLGSPDESPDNELTTFSPTPQFPPTPPPPATPPPVTPPPVTP
ncbi:MAG: hypothetical protein AAF571_04480 [Verrucomicrobiota bacterium]